MASRDPLVVFMPSGKRGNFPQGTPLLQAARSLGVDIDSVCGGRALCGRCQVLVAEGEFAKLGVSSSSSSLTELSEPEKRFSRRAPLAAGRRLSCSARVLSDVVIDVPASSQVHRQVVRKEADARAIELNPVVRLHYVQVNEPDMHDPSGDLRRLFEALEREWGLKDLACDLSVLQILQGALRKGAWQVTVAVHAEKQIIGVWPGLHETALGLAVDIGSTTIAAHLCDLTSGEVVASAGAMNPQIRFGEDLMSRVSYSMMNPGGAALMTAAVREALNGLAAEVARGAGATHEDILEATLVGNPIMHHLLLGIDPVELGGAPFALATDTSLTLRANVIDLKLHRNARVYVLPCIAGHVGADAAGVVLSERPDLGPQMTLLVDVGTNAEIVLGNSQRLVACSSPTGPAFEGAQISCGQRAAPGAIERVRIDRETLEPRFKVIGSDLWSDEPGFEKSTAGIGITGVCGSGIIEVIAEMYLAGIINQDGVIDGRLAARSPRIVENGRTFAYLLHRGASDPDPSSPGGAAQDGAGVQMRITQNDVRAIQLAKAALYAGVALLMERLGVDHVDRIRLAGAFGSHIDVKYATLLGMLPDCDLAQVRSAGNAAGTGARIALLDATSRPVIETLVRRIEKVETAIEPRFQHHFVEAMAIPHKSAPYTNLRKVVDLPAPKESTSQAETRGRRPRRALKTD
ncbi:MAG TPA: ASKHA domain-containing protein [Steroidobacteraceae bacterium]|nr:ASKHA domain-containing protein [Steroidobacteraceae bacterium]